MSICGQYVTSIFCLCPFSFKLGKNKYIKSSLLKLIERDVDIWSEYEYESEYVVCSTPMKIICEFGHNFTICSGNLKFDNSWCDKCAGNSRDKEYHTEMIHDLVDKNNGTWVSETVSEAVSEAVSVQMLNIIQLYCRS